MIGQTLLRYVSRSYQPKMMSKSLRCYMSDSKKQPEIKFDQEQIKRKMKEIKNRKEDVKDKKDVKLEFMTMNTNTQIARKMRKYRQATQTQNLLHFADPSLEEKPTTLQITGYDQESIEVDTMIYPPSMIIFRNQLLVWQVLGLEQLTIDDFIILKYISPKPIYVIVGVNDPSKFPKHIYEYLSANNINFDVLELFQAVSQFNVTANDDLDVVAFLLSKS